MRFLTGAIAVSVCVLSLPFQAAAADLFAIKTKSMPLIDGLARDAVWAEAPAIVTRDAVAEIDIELKAVHTGEQIAILVTFSDSDENRQHKTMAWVAAQERYRTGVDREDTFVLKWSMEPGLKDLSVRADYPYKADIWFWKAHRTDSVGFADDKMQIYSFLPSTEAKVMVSKGGGRFFLIRMGDAGDAAYEEITYPVFSGENLPKYRFSVPQGSRADVRAKGVWSDGKWTVEFARNLKTGHPDDIEFDPSQAYFFGVSRYEIAGRVRNESLEDPFYGAGDVGEALWLKFQ